MNEDNLTRTIRDIKAMMEMGWTAAAIAKEGDVNQITVGNIKNGKASRVSDKVCNKMADLRKRVESGSVEAPKRGRKPASGTAVPGKAMSAPQATRKAAASPKTSAASTPGTRTTASRGTASPAAASMDGMINTNYVPVDIVRLQGMIDRLIGSFAGAIDELEQIKSQLKV